MCTGGVTIHTFAGISARTVSAPELIRCVLRSREAIARWQNVKTLIIDEISMLGEMLSLNFCCMFNLDRHALVRSSGSDCEESSKLSTDIWRDTTCA